MTLLTLKCKSCGGTIPVDSKESFVTCPYCGNIYDVPMDEKKEQYLNLYSRADDAWDHKDFEEAAELYQQILNIDNTQSEAHFGLVLCKYGITYEIDPVTQKKMPTCNRINRDSILDDKHFLAAVKYGAKDAADSFRSRAQEIDRISRDFLKIVDKEPPYDVFISYKRTAADGSVTQDSKVGRKLYYHLKDKGFKVFFAEETLKSVAGEKYEPYIFAALSSAPVMVLVGSSRDHFEATWVKNEWRRYLVLMNQGLKKTLIPAYFEMDPYHMPGELRTLQAMNAYDFTFHEDITEIIRKKVSDAKSDNNNEEVKGVSLRDKYAPKEKVEKLLDATDCDREFAINVLVQCHGDLKQSQKFIEEDPDYLKSLWTCADCNTKNTHSSCRNCGVSKKESMDVARLRKDMEERRRKQSSEYKSQKRRRAKKFFSALASVLVVCAILGGIGAFGYFVVYQKLIYPNLEVKDLNTPEIVQVYSGTYDAGSTDGTAMLTILSCDDSGNLTGTFEFFVESAYGKYDLTGHIESKKNNGEVELVLLPGEWIIEAEGFNPIDRMDVTISDNYQTFSCPSLRINWSVGGNDEYNIKTADDLKKLANSQNTYMLVNDIDLEGEQWTPIDGFKGTLMGNGFSIKNLKIDASASNVGFFATLEGTVQGLNFENAEITVTGHQENVGVLCGVLMGNTVNVTVSGTVEAASSNCVGGIAGYAYSSYGNMAFGNLENSADINGADYVGGIFGKLGNDGYGSDTTQLSGFTNSGQINGKSYTGGIIGSCEVDTKLKASTFSNTGDVTGALYVGGLAGWFSASSGSSDDYSYIEDSSSGSAITGEAYVGCIAGKADGVLVNSCSNTGSTLTATKYVTEDGAKNAYVGGYVGYAYGVNDCVNEVAINYTAGGSYVGGIAGYVYRSYGNMTFGNLENTAAISGSDYVGGIFGKLGNDGYGSDTTQLSGFTNSGQISGKSYTGGIIGSCEVDTKLKVSTFSNTGDVSGALYVGGLSGWFSASSGSSDDFSYVEDSSSGSAITGEAYVGCIAGKADGVLVNSCSNTGSTLTATKYVTEDGAKNAYVGGYVGYAYGVNDCVNEVAINYTAGGSYVGGIAGYVYRSYENMTLSNLENTAAISGSDYVGGIFGKLGNDGYGSDTTQLSGFTNSGQINGNSYTGGIIGSCEVDTKLYVLDCVNEGAVIGSSYCGGLIGFCKGSGDSYIQDSSTTNGSLVGESENVTIQ